MGKWLVLLLIIAGFSGTYWTVMSGYATEKALAFDIRGAARQTDAQSILDDLKKAEGRLDAQRRWVQRFAFIARNPDWSRVDATRDMLHELQAMTSEVIATSGGEIGSEATEKLKALLRSMRPLDAQIFRPGEDTVWKALFWASAAGVVILGLLMFVRRVGD